MDPCCGPSTLLLATPLQTLFASVSCWLPGRLKGEARLVAPSRRNRQELFSLDVWLSGPWGWQAMMLGCHVSSRGGLGEELHQTVGAFVVLPSAIAPHDPSSHREI